MSTQVIYELQTTLSQQITAPATPQSVVDIRLHLMKWGSPAGSLYVEIRDSLNALVATSSPVLISDITTAASGAAYAHGMVRFQISCGLAASSVYSIVLKSTNYAYDPAAFIAWCNDYDLRCNSASYSPSAGLSAALRYEFWTLKNGTRGGAVI